MTLEEHFKAYCQASWAGETREFQVTAHPHFLAGAAAMAEQFAAGSGPALEVLRGIRDEIAKSNRLAQEIKL